MPGGMIISGAAGLPRNFRVIEASSYRDAIRGMKAAFQNPETTLVVWSNAGAMLSDDMKDMIYEIVRKGREHQNYRDLAKSLFSPSSRESKITANFNKFAKGIGFRPDLLQVWRRDSEEFIQTIHDEFEIKNYQSLLRLKKIGKSPEYHLDLVNARSLVAVRVLSGDSTEYYRSEDVFQGWPHLDVKPDAEIWRVPSGSIAFHARDIVHSAPSLKNSGGLAAGQKRLIETQSFWAKQDFVACQMK